MLSRRHFPSKNIHKRTGLLNWGGRRILIYYYYYYFMLIWELLSKTIVHPKFGGGDKSLPHPPPSPPQRRPCEWKQHVQQKHTHTTQTTNDFQRSFQTSRESRAKRRNNKKTCHENISKDLFRTEPCRDVSYDRNYIRWGWGDRWTVAVHSMSFNALSTFRIRARLSRH